MKTTSTGPRLSLLGSVLSQNLRNVSSCAPTDVKNRRGQQARGRKITGMQFLPGNPAQLLITSNDSRLRLYDGYTLRCKFKGLHNRWAWFPCI